jgi:hypothetical protein
VPPFTSLSQNSRFAFVLPLIPLVIDCFPVAG